jgi:tetratricopeptide (TPR) repeat protein
MKAGDRVDHYQLLKTLGHGGMGGVWIAFDPEHNDLVAVKTLFEEYKGGGKTERTYYLALEYIRGMDLADFLKANGRISVADALPVISSIARAMSYAHEQGVIHRDIKPSNIMLSTEGKIAKILDFGVAHAEDPNLMTATGDVVGTFLYASPEQNQGKQIDERSDVYALGLTFHELLTGKRVLKGANHQEVTAMQLTVPIQAPSKLVPSVPVELDRILLRMLEVEQEKRYQTCDELLVDLDAFVSDPQEFAQDRRSIYEYPDLVPEFKVAQQAFREERWDQAIEAAQSLLGRAPRAAELHVLVGQAHRAKGLPFNAVNAFKRAITFERGNIGYHMELAQTYEQMGMEGPAIETYETILVIEPNSTKAKRRLAAIKGGEPAGGEEESAPAAPAAPVSALQKTLEDARRRSQHGQDKIRVTAEMIAAANARGKADDPAEAAGSSDEDLEARSKVLAEALVATIDPTRDPVLTGLFWPYGFFRFGRVAAGGGMGLLELALLAGFLFFFTNPGWVPPESFGEAAISFAAAHPGESARYGQMACGLLWLLGAGWLAFEIYSVAPHINKQAYVVEVDSEEQTVLLNAGAGRGFAKGDRLLAYQPLPHSAGSGELIGEVKLVEVLPGEAAGRFYPSGDKVVRFGDFVISAAAVHDGGIDPTKPSKDRFPEGPQN